MAEEKEEKSKQKRRRPQAEKREIQSRKRNLRNRAFASRMKTEMKGLKTSIEQKNKEKIQEGLNTIYSILDKGLKTNKLTANKVNRVKSRFSKLANSLT